MVRLDPPADPAMLSAGEAAYNALGCKSCHGKDGVKPSAKTYPVIARISATSGAIRSDRVRGVRGLGLKILGVESQERAHADFMKDKNQDFVFVTEPEFLFRDAADYAKGGMATAKILGRTPALGVNATIDMR